MKASRLGPVMARVLCPGGVIGAAQLRRVADAALALGDGRVRAGSRQDLMIAGVDAGDLVRLRRQVEPLGVAVAGGSGAPANILSSVAAVIGAAPAAGWPTAGELQELAAAAAAAFAPEPAPPFSLSLVDPRQDCVPRFASRVNLLARAERGIWRPWWAAPGAAGAVASRWSLAAEAVPVALRAVAAALARDPDAPAGALDRALAEAIRPRLLELDAPPAPHPARGGYGTQAGFMTLASGRSRLGIAMPPEGYCALFVLEAALLAARGRPRPLALSPWRALLIGDLDPAGDVPEWRRLLSRHRLAARPAGEAALWWWMPAERPRTSRLAGRLAGRLDRAMGAGAALSFGIAKPGEPLPPVALTLRPAGRGALGGARFDLLARAGLDPEATEVIEATRAVPERRLATAIARLAEVAATHSSAPRPAPAHPSPGAAPPREVLQCRDCLTVIDPAMEPGGAAQHQACPLCDAPAAHFEPISEETLAAMEA